MLIQDLMSTPAITVLGETPVGEALHLLDEHKISALPVVDRRGHLVGVVSEADLMQDALQLDDRALSVPIRMSASARPRRVAEVMARLVVSVHSDDVLDDAIDLLRATMVKSLPVLQENRVIGVISRSDVIHFLAERDTQIRTDVARRLHDRNPDWRVEVDDGVVKVSGPVSDQARHQAEAVVGTVRGVIAVHVS
ncbi:BON domain-containing protein [Kribbella steppae]|uniref:BON domain-containing protein n=1 Tax=Kribbella steppae TaxID=2512223 RepID=A0A4R2H4B2_9ACTN|nr:CBS domain-containing protein [Kribbella steppae]TCO20317.1 BON domain-containing protein [Kribbella steppae]